MAGCPGPPIGMCHGPHVCVLKKKHQDESRRRVYTAFSAICDGCESCVRKALQDKTVDATTRSDSGQYSLMDWAEYGKTHFGKDTAAVMKFLATLESSGGAESAVSRPFEGDVPPGHCRFRVCVPRPCGRRHELVWKERWPDGDANLEFLMAAHTGCGACVMHFVERQGEDVNMVSDGGAWTVLSWVHYGALAGYDTEYVRDYLVSRGAREAVPRSIGSQALRCWAATSQETGATPSGGPTEEPGETVAAEEQSAGAPSAPASSTGTERLRGTDVWESVPDPWRESCVSENWRHWR
jgi:hypothetical protein